MAWTKLLTPEWVGLSGAANILKIRVKDVKAQIAANQLVTKKATTNVTEIKFHKTDGTPKYIPARPGAADPTPPPRPGPSATSAGS